ncbi:MAG: hypothetical protein PUH18_06275 [Coriobacteriaceae bacterium]|nr:hypothetical protein [Coriobacteriaceae bacterium]
MALFDAISGAANEAKKVAEEAHRKAAEATEAAIGAAGIAADAIAGGAAAVADGASHLYGNAVNMGKEAIEAPKRAEEEWQANRNAELEATQETIRDTVAESLLNVLGDSPITLDRRAISNIKAVFPIPAEQCVLWADAEFDLRPSGIVFTDRGLFVKSDVDLFGRILNKEEAVPSKLTFFSWGTFEPNWYAGDDAATALAVDPKCSGRFITACKAIAYVEDNLGSMSVEKVEAEISDQDGVKQASAPIVAAAAAESAEQAVFAEQKSLINNPAGHGEMAEKASHMIDRAHGHTAEWLGPENTKNGADRLVDNVYVQTKYYKTARGSLEAAFDPATGSYRYMQNGSPMQLEVPKDQYGKVLEGFRKKIKDGKVPGVTNPADAEKYVRRGRLTYDQAVNLTKPGTVESLAYDAATGAVICSCAFGISFVATVFTAYRASGDMEDAVRAGIGTGVQVFGISFLQHIVVSQVARTSLAGTLNKPASYIVEKMGHKASQSIVNGLRALSGKSAISGAAATKQLTKILRSNALTTAISMAVLSAPETYNLVTKKISGSQYAKNMVSLTGSVAGGAGGAVAAGVAAAKVAGAAGTAVAPGVGTAVGIAGGFAGGLVGSKVAGAASDVFWESDAQVSGRLLNAYIAYLASEYLMSDSEMEAVVKRFDEIASKDFQKLFDDVRASDEQENTIRTFLEPHFEAVVSERKPFALPTDGEILGALVEAEEISEEDASQT